MTNLTKSKERVSELGEVFTPDHIVSEMHALLDDKVVWEDPTMVYLEPTCGNGQFLVQAVQKKLDAGLSPERAVNTVFGMDLMDDNVEESRFRVMDVVVKHMGRGSMPVGSLQERVLFAIICNNIFQADTLKFLAKGPKGEDSHWDKKKFLYDDPSKNGQVLVSHELITWLDKNKKAQLFKRDRKWSSKND